MQGQVGQFALFYQSLNHFIIIIFVWHVNLLAMIKVMTANIAHLKPAFVAATLVVPLNKRVVILLKHVDDKIIRFGHELILDVDLLQNHVAIIILVLRVIVIVFARSAY